MLTQEGGTTTPPGGMLGAGVMGAALLAIATPATAQTTADSAAAASAAGEQVQDSAAEIAQLRAQLEEARARIADQERRLGLLEQRLAGVAQNAQAARDEVAAVREQPATAASSGTQRVTVGEVPVDHDRAPVVAVLDEQGSVLTRRGQLIGEVGLDYTRSDRNRAVFRGVELIESILVGVFDINESRQDIITDSASLRFGLADRVEIGGRVPFIFRSDKSIVVPIAGSTNNDTARTVDSSVRGTGIGDVEFTARYQLNHPHGGSPFLIANMQATAPTGRSAFDVPRDANGGAKKVATGAGFWGLSPSVTAILPSEPAVLFGTVGYTFNLARNVNTRIPPVQIDRVNPGDAINLSAGIGLAINDRTSLNLGYAHSWTFGTQTWARQLDRITGEPTGDRLRTRSRDLQIGRFLFGVTQRVSPRINVSWSVEVGATQDAPDVRTLLRVPIVF